MNRRQAVQGILVGGAVVAVPGVARARNAGVRIANAAPPHSASPPAAAGEQEIPAPWHLIAPLKPGSEIALGWSVVALSAVVRGASILTLRGSDGRSSAIHLCQRGERPCGIAHTETVDLILMNGAEGRAPTEESLGRVIKTLALRIRENERRCPRSDGSLLMTHDRRMSEFGPQGLS